MSIRPLIHDNQSFTPEEAKVLVEAFEESLKALRLVDREDPATLLVAEKVLEAARGGERDPRRLRALVLRQFESSGGTTFPARERWREVESSPRIEEFRRHAAYCEEAAAVASDPLAKATFAEAAASWRELAAGYQRLLSLGNRS